jgi:hypothetical protein
MSLNAYEIFARAGNTGPTHPPMRFAASRFRAARFRERLAQAGEQNSPSERFGVNVAPQHGQVWPPRAAARDTMIRAFSQRL